MYPITWPNLPVNSFLVFHRQVYLLHWRQVRQNVHLLLFVIAKQCHGSLDNIVSKGFVKERQTGGGVTRELKECQLVKGGILDVLLQCTHKY